MENFDVALKFYVRGILERLEKQLNDAGKTGTYKEGYTDAKSAIVDFFRQAQPGYYWPRHYQNIDGIVLNGQDATLEARTKGNTDNSRVVYENGYRTGIPETVSAITLRDYKFDGNDLIRDTIPK
jgi:hypothetical protein